jgi:hypothetical protein
LIAAEKTNYPVAVMCCVLHISRTGFHNWERRALALATIAAVEVLGAFRAPPAVKAALASRTT